MNSKTIPLFPFSVIVFCFTLANAATFNIRNNCKYTVWAAATPGGGKQVNSGETWDLEVADGTARARIWARTNCYFDGNERGSCQTGDCGGLLQCQDYGSAPNTLVQYSLNQYDNLDYFDISLVEGFNVPVELSSTSAGCSKDIRCSVNITAECPDPLKTPGGCHNPCTVYKSDTYCCNSGNCVPTDFSNFFKARCPNAYSYPKDDQTSLFTCPAGTNYLVVFCP